MTSPHSFTTEQGAPNEPSVDVAIPTPTTDDGDDGDDGGGETFFPDEENGGVDNPARLPGLAQRLRQRKTELLRWVKALPHRLSGQGLFIVVGVFFVLVMLVSLVMLLLTSKPTPRATQQQNVDTHLLAVNARLSTIQDQLASMARAFSHAPDFNEEARLEAQLHAINTNLTQLTAQAPQAISQSLGVNNAAMAAQLSTLSQHIDALKHSLQTVDYLPASALPFHVLSIDAIEDDSVVTVTYGFRTFPLEEGYTVAGWTLRQASYINQVAVFENEKHQQVSVSLGKTPDRSKINADLEVPVDTETEAMS